MNPNSRHERSEGGENCSFCIRDTSLWESSYPSGFREVRFSHYLTSYLDNDSLNLHNWKKGLFHVQGVSSSGGGTPRVHCIHMQKIEEADGDKKFKAIFCENDPLEWFDE